MSVLTFFDPAFVSQSQAGGTLWTPAEITTVFWFKGNDLSTIADTSGNVDQWDDKSGNGNHATATSTTRPTTGDETLNGKNVISFNGSQRMSLPQNLLAASGACVIFVGKFGPHAGDDQYIVFGFNPRFYAPNRNSTSFTWWFNETSEFHLITANTDPQIFGLRHDGSNTAYALYNGEEIDSLSNTPTGNIVSWALGGTTTEGRLDGYIAEVVGLQNPNTANIDRVVGYFAHEWGLTANLPSGHPYKNAAPVVEEVSGYDPDAQAYIDRLTGTYSTAELDAINQLFLDLKAAVTIFSRFHYINLCWLDNASDAVLDLMGDTHTSGGYPLTNNGATFTARQGFTTDGVDDYLDTGWVPSTDGGSQNSITVGGYFRQLFVDEFAVAFGATGTNFNQIFIEPNRSGNAQGRMCTSSTTYSVSGASPGTTQITRRGATDSEFYSNGVSLGTSSATSTGLPDASIWYGARNAASPAYLDNQLAAAWALDSITDTEAANISAAFEACADAFGAGVVA
jgi:hypothetical protein